MLFASVSKRVFVRNYSYGNVFHLLVHFNTYQTHFCTKIRFETDAQGKSEMACSYTIFIYSHDTITFIIVIYPNNPDSCRVESQYWSLCQYNLCHHGAVGGWCRSGSLLWFPRHRSLNKRSSSTMLYNSHQLQKQQCLLAFSLGRLKRRRTGR